MAIDLGPTLETALRDTSNAVWGATEIDAILANALDETNRVRPRVVRDTIACVADQDTYTLTNVYEVFRVDLIDSDSKLVKVLAPGTWEVWGDNMSSGQTLYVNPNYSLDTYSFRVHGYGPYDFTTNTPPTQVQAAIVAVARAEALRRVATERARYEHYATANPRSDVSVNELMIQLNEADNEKERLLRDIRLMRRPTVGRFPTRL